MHFPVELTFAHALYHPFDVLILPGNGRSTFSPKAQEIIHCPRLDDYNAHSHLARMVEYQWWTDDVQHKMTRLETVEVVFYDKEMDARMRDGPESRQDQLCQQWNRDQSENWDLGRMWYELRQLRPSSSYFLMASSTEYPSLASMITIKLLVTFPSACILLLMAWIQLHF